MTYQIARDGVQLGEFSEKQVQAGLKNGSVLETDLAWCEGMISWQPVSAVFGTSSQRSTGAPSSMPRIPNNASGLATWSMVLGIASLVTLFIAGIPAIICGHVALGRIRRSGGSLPGRGRAVTGLVLGYLMTLGLVPIAILASLAVPTFSKIQEKGNQTKAINNARQIIIGLKLYAADNNGKYPDKLKNGSSASDSNTAFRELFINGALENESIFGCPASPYVPDGNIGTAPDYREALKPGENHWAMTGGLNDSSSGAIPVVYENTSSGAAWPPTWNTAIPGRRSPGRTWSGGKVIIGFNDGSVELVRLGAEPNEHAAPKLRLNGTPVIPSGSGNFQVLNPR